MASIINGVLMCAKCGKPVERVESGIDPMTGDYVFTAFCHGKSEVSILTRAEMAMASRIDYAVAFEKSSAT